MAVVLTPLGKAVVGIAKWVVAPLIVAYIGYTFIGPRIGAKDPNPVKKVRPKNQAPKSEHGQQFKDIRTN
ncbi:MAG TPA: hypothetical protein VK171_09485 [Fimbriimonas sp.]|nr:hypothetical protein [Fimbriimonas sp.]